MIAKPARDLPVAATAGPILDYVHHDKDGARTSERVKWAENVNCVQASPEETERMWTQLVADAPELKRQAGGSARGRRLENPFGHYILAWHPDEKPSKEHVLESVGSAMQELGYKGCQYRVVAHQDTDHLHAHVIVCRVNPENGRAMGRKNDVTRLREWSLDYERRQGKIRVPGRLDDLTLRRRHVRELRNGQTPTPRSPEAKERRRERRQRRKTRDAISRPITLTDTERQEWAAALAGNPSSKEKADLRRRQTRRRLDAAGDRHQRARPVVAATAKPGIQLRPTPDGPPRARPGQRVTGPGATAKPGIQLRPTPDGPPRARPGRKATGPGATARPGIQLRPTPDGPPRARPGRKVTGPGATARPGIQLPRDLERQLELARIVEGNRRREREAARAAAKAKAEEQTVATAAEEQTPAPTGDQRDDIRRRFNNACVDSRTGIKEIAADFGESLPRRLDWAAVDATMQDEEGDPRYQARTAGLDIGSARMGLERYLLEEARPYRPRGAAVADSVRAAITRIRETVDKFIEGILEKLLPDRGQPATPDRPAAATRAPVEQRTAPPAPETPEAAPVRGADEEPGGASRPRPAPDRDRDVEPE